jgi:hypothetical protein
MTANPAVVVKSILKYAWGLRRPRAFLTKALFRATPKRLHFLLFKIPWGICSASGFVRVSLGEAGTTFNCALKIVGRSPGAEETPVVRSKFTAPKRTAELFVVAVEGGYSAHLGMNFSSDGRLISDVSYEGTMPVNNRSSGGNSTNFDYDQWLRHNYLEDLITVRFPVCTYHTKSNVVSLTSRIQWSYFHWLFDVLPRVHLAKMAGIGTACYYVECAHSFQNESLHLLGIRGDAIIAADRNPIIQASTLFIPSYPEAFTGIPPWCCDFLRSSLLVECQRSRPYRAHAEGKRIYVSRRDAKTRRLTNESELIDLLMRYGFVVIEPGRMSVTQQVRAFAEADVIIGLHGAGLANIVFCQKGTTVIEIAHPKYIFGVYHDLATRCHLDHYLVFGDGADLSRDYGWTHRLNDYSVDLPLVQRALENSCAGRWS